MYQIFGNEFDLYRAHCFFVELFKCGKRENIRCEHFTHAIK